MSKRKTFTLSEPVRDIDGTELTALELRKPKAKDLRVFDRVEGEIAGTYELVAKLAGIPVSQVDEMELSDLGPIMEWVTGFLPKGLADTDGATS